MTNVEQLELLYEIFDASLPRLAPGDTASTGKALDYALKALGRSDGLQVLDLGCGNGASTLELARRGIGAITAVDNHGPFLEELLKRAKGADVADRIQTLEADMATIAFDVGDYDLIWSEGSMYNMGVEAGLKHFRAGLKPDGVMALSELCWMKEEVPATCREFFMAEYPPMQDVPANLRMMESCGYTVLETSTLPESAWWLDYYLPLESRLATLQEKYAGDEDRMGVLATVAQEIAMYRGNSDYYGYVFYVLQV